MNAVKRAAPLSVAMGGRCGTAAATTNMLFAAFGEPTHDWRADPCDGKVTLSWVFDTPRGKAEIRDYWWNAPDIEWTIAAPSRKPAMWLAKYLRSIGIPASTKFYKLENVTPFAK